MSTTTPPITPPSSPHSPSSSGGGGGEVNYINATKGIKSWMFTVDHKRIGLMYMVGVMSAYGLGGLFAILLRSELWNPEPSFIGGAEAGTTEAMNNAWDFYNQAFTLHGAVMVFLFIIPAIPAILGNMVLPIMLGAKDVAFPRLNLLSFYFWVLGGLFFVWVLSKGIINSFYPGMIEIWGPGGLETGWTFYTPYSTTTQNSAVVAATFGAFILGFSSILTGLNFIATVHMLRPKGMGWFQLPLFLWALYATAIIQILATPVLAITLLLLIAEKTLGVGIFNPALGGDAVLYQHFFWFYSHPAVYIMILPALGIISEVVSVHSRKSIFGYKFIAISSLAIAFLGFLVWGHHMFTSGQSALTNAVFSLITFFVAVPSAIKTFNWIATMYKGDIRITTPFIYILFTIGLFTIGGLTGLFLGCLSTDIHFHDTYFVVAHFHYVMMGSTLFAFLAGVYHWFPKMFGKMYNVFWSNLGGIIAFIGFQLAFFIQFIAGSQGMPRRYASYPEHFEFYHQVSTVGAYTMGAGMIIVLLTWIVALRTGKKAPANPWGGNTLEWHTTSPPPTANFHAEPTAEEPYDYSGWKYVSPEEGWVQRTPEEREAARQQLGTGH